MNSREERDKRNDERKGDFKKGIDANDATEKRAEDVVKLRKAKREQQLKRVRRQVADKGGNTEGPGGPPQAFTPEHARQIMIGLQTGTPESRSSALRALRQLTASDEPQLGVLHSMHVVAVLQKVLTGGQGDDRIDALWCLTNLASGSHDTTVPLYAVIPHIVHLLGVDDVAVADQAAWCLGNIAGDCADCRARVISNGAVAPLVELLKRDGPPQLLVTLGFAVCNLVRAGGALADFVNRGLIALVLRLLTPVQHVEVVAEMAWLLTYIAAGEDAYKATIVSMGGLELCVQLCASPVTGSAPAVMIPLMRGLGNLCGAPDAVVVRMLANRGFLQALWSRLSVPDNNLLREVCWALNNLTGGPPEASAALVQVSYRPSSSLAPPLTSQQMNFVPPLAALLNGAVMSVRKEVGFVFLNMVSALRDSTPILPLLASTPGVMSSFIEFLSMPDVEMIGMGLRWASQVLRHLPGGKHVFEENHGVIALEDLEYNNHKNEELFRKANDLLNKYFTDMDDEEELELMTEAAPPPGGYAF